MSIIDDLLWCISLCAKGYSGSYKEMRKLMIEYASYNGTSLKEKSVSSALSRLKTKGVIAEEKGVWKLSKTGEELMQKKNQGLRHFYPKMPDVSNTPKEVLIFFDIPEKQRYKRDWLRSELVGLGYEIIQQSVWFGPRLPEELMKYLEEKEILQYLNIFRVNKELFRKDTI